MKRIVLAAMMMIAMMSAGSCKKDNGGDDDGGGGSGSAKGQVELNGKKYPLHEGSVIIAGSSVPYNYTLTLKSANGNTNVILMFRGSSGSEIATGTYDSEAFAFSGTLSGLDGGNLSDIAPFLQDQKIVVAKSGNDFDMTYTAKVPNASGSMNYDFKATYKGAVKVIKN